MNIALSPYALVYKHLPTQEDFRLPFRVTADQGAPDNRMEWPVAERVLPQRADAPRTTASGVLVAGVSATLEPAAGPVLSKPVLTVQGLTPNQPVEVPDDLGGWHALKLAQNGRVVAEAPYFVERSLVSVSAKKVRAGERFTVRIKGMGWTELDNGLAMTYDNAYVGYACGCTGGGSCDPHL